MTGHGECHRPPVKSRHIPMPVEAFHRLPWDLGWKYEYWDGQAHVTPREHAVQVTLDLAPRPASSPPGLRAPRAADAPRLLRAYLASFADGIEYCDWTSPAIRGHARKTLCGYFDGARGKPFLGASRVVSSAAGSARSIAGAALVVAAGRGRARLDLLFVVPRERRRGLASAMVADAVGVLHRAGLQVLESAYVLGNMESEAWHRGFGFREEPDWLLARLKLAQARHDLERREREGDLSPEERAQLVRALAEHRAEVARLEAQGYPKFTHHD
jgi:GNAT superfamily N-acetyltransferase